MGKLTAKGIEQNKIDKVKMLLILIVLLLFFAGSIIAYYNSEEQKAKRIVETYLFTIKTGKGNPYENIDIDCGIFINVLDYKYLVTTEKQRVPKEPLILDRRLYEMFYREQYETYHDFLDDHMKISHDAERIGDKVVVQRPGHYYKFAFLYDMVITNKIGMKLFNKYTFEVKQKASGYEIVSYREGR